MKSMKKWAIFMAVILCVTAVFAGCSGGGESSAPPASDNSSGGNSSGGTTETLNIAYFGPHQDNEYQIGLWEGV